MKLVAAVNEVNNNLNGADDAVAEQQFFRGNAPGNQAIEELKECYEKIVFWRKNLFMITKRSSRKDYIKEITRLINEWLIGSLVRECAMYALHVMPALLLQKASKCPKSKDRVAALKRRLVFATFERSDRPSKSVSKDWNNEKHQRGIKEVP